ncbi:hypothetical protein RJ640_020551 [Escallonia rubra]|uniref:histidine kinase n=1 Tax=Escallonia rubra TaxID=112253 RepID=A0AA88RVV9_9ASTE|nr:hypothetical protein RJ640_020551 [Escallonia rubra]
MSMLQPKQKPLAAAAAAAGAAAAAAPAAAAAAAAAAAPAARTGYNPLEEFFEADRNPDEDKPVVYGICSSLLFRVLNVALDLARREAETAVRARNDFLAVMNHEMGTPMHAIIAVSSLLQETELTPEQRLMVETILKSSNLLATLINDVLDLSRLEDGSLQLDIGTFNLHALFREVGYQIFCNNNSF